MDDYEGLTPEELQEEYDRLLVQIDESEASLTQIATELASLTALEQLGEIPLAQQAIRWDRIGVLIKNMGSLIEEIENLVEEFGVVQSYLNGE